MKMNLLIRAWNHRCNIVIKTIDIVSIAVLVLALIRGLVSVGYLISPAWLAIIAIFSAPIWVWVRLEDAWKHYQTLDDEQGQARERLRQTDIERTAKN